MFEKLWQYYTRLGSSLCKLKDKLKKKPEGDFNEVIDVKLTKEEYNEIDKETIKTNKNSSTMF